MCGIAGQIRQRGPVERGALVAMTDALRHRGPDDEGIHIENPSQGPSVGLGHRRLSIIDLSHDGRQPMCNEDGTLWIVLNGEIYNYPELRRYLIGHGHRFSSRTDTEVVLHLYEEFGTACLEHLRGMFAFALWDAPRKRLFAARDRVGKKPFYYAHKPEGFFFASEIQALTAASEVRREIDPAALEYFLEYTYIPAPHSIYKDVRKLPPGHCLLLEGGRLSLIPYWQVRFAPKKQIAYPEAKSALMEKLSEATRIRLNSDVPLGCFLSGGIDSSLIAALMARNSSRKVRTFSIGFPHAEFDESGYAREVARHLGTEHTEFEVTPRAVEVLPHIVRHYGEPFADSSALPTWYLSEMTRQHVTVALNGDGGDELFAGYDWYGTALMLGRAGRICPPSLARILAWTLQGQVMGNGLGRKAWRFLDLLGMSAPQRFQSLRQLLPPETARRLYRREFLEGRCAEVKSYVQQWYTRPDAAEELDRMLFADTLTYLPEELLVKVDRATMAHGLEGRSPLLDHELMEFAASLPSEYKRKDGGGKHILRDCLGELVPRELFERPKMGFSVPLDDWFRGELKGYLEERVEGGALGELELFDMEGIRGILREHAEGQKSHGSLLWRLLTLSHWLELHAS